MEALTSSSGQTQPKSAADIEKEQEELLKAKYGGMRPKKKLMPKDHKYFDSADWALSKQGVQPESGTGVTPKLEPSAAPPRRVSHLGDEEG